MKKRVISGLIMAPLLIIVYLGGYPLMAGCIFIGIVGVRELFRGFEAMDIHPSFAVACGAAALLYALDLAFPLRHEYLTGWLVFSIMASSVYIFKIEGRKAEDAMATMLGIIYVIFFSYHIRMTDELRDYRILIWMIFIASFGTDICAYFSGLLLGRHKLCPGLSPKKTVEGAVGGAAGAVLLSVLFGYLVCRELLPHCLILGFAASAASQFGDLTASAYKRRMGIKDYGNLIPGHGGIMDRFDSVLFTAPVVYYYIQFVLVG